MSFADFVNSLCGPQDHFTIQRRSAGTSDRWILVVAKADGRVYVVRARKLSDLIEEAKRDIPAADVLQRQRVVSPD